MSPFFLCHLTHSLPTFFLNSQDKGGCCHPNADILATTSPFFSSASFATRAIAVGARVRHLAQMVCVLAGRQLHAKAITIAGAHDMIKGRRGVAITYLPLSLLIFFFLAPFKSFDTKQVAHDNVHARLPGVRSGASGRLFADNPPVSCGRRVVVLLNHLFLALLCMVA